MSEVDYEQTAEDHQSFLVLVKHTGQKLTPKHFTKFWERIQLQECISIAGQSRSVWVRYRHNYLKENNEWGDFQAHRKVLGLVCLGRCASENEFDALFEDYRKQKDEYSNTLFNSRLIVVGMNQDGSSLTEEQKKRIAKASSPPPVQDGESSPRFEIGSNGQSKQEKRTAKVLSSENVKDVLEKETHKIVIERSKSSASDLRGSVKRTYSNSLTKENTGAEVIFYPSFDSTDDFEEKICEFVTSLFFVLEGKRLDRSFERSDRIQLLCAPFEKKDYVGVDTDTRSFKKKCQGRLRKHLADLCLQAGLPGEAMLHYNTAIDILRPVNDSLWIGACFEGLCSASIILSFPPVQSVAAPGLRRNQSFSVKRGVSGQQDSKITRSGSIMRSYANGLQDLPETMTKTSLNPDDIVEKYKEALQFYSKYKNAGLVEIEASFKACRILITQRKYLQASDFLQNVVYISLQISDEDKIERYATLSALYEQIGFLRKAAFYKRVAAMQCVVPQNPKQNWQQCHTLLLQVLEGYRIHMDPRQMVPKSGAMNGWPVLQSRVLHELVYSAKRMGNLPLAIRHTSLMLHALLHYLTPQERREIVASLESLTSQCEGTMQPLLLDDGTIIPPVPFTNIPTVKSFKLLPLHPHLEPRALLGSGETASENVFIFTPLSLTSSTGSADSISCAKMDFMWVEGDVAEVQLHVINHMPDELRVSSISLMTEGVELETFPCSPCVPAESSPYLVKVMCRPKSNGEITIIGYKTKVYGTNSTCRLRDLHHLPQDSFKVKVIPALPQVQLSTTLPKAASFISFGEDSNVVTTATLSVFMGQSVESQVTMQNAGSQFVDLIRVNIEAYRESQGFIEEVFRWNKDNIDSQLPLSTSKLICFTMAISGIGDFLTAKQSPLADREGQTDDRFLASDGKCVEAILKVEYSGAVGQDSGYCRLCSVAYTVDILPSIVFHRWDVLPAESPESVYLLFDVENQSGHEMSLQYAAQSTMNLEPDQLRRIEIKVERCKFPTDLVKKEQTYNTIHTDLTPEPYSQFIGELVDIRWQIPSLNVSGQAVIDYLTWTPEQLALLQISPLNWDVRVNGEMYTALRIGAVDISLGDTVEVEVEMNVNSDIPEADDMSGTLSISCCQNCDNGTISSELTHQVVPLGCPDLSLAKINSTSSVKHSCSFLFTCCGVYQLSIKAELHRNYQEVKVQEVKNDMGLSSDVWRCSSVIEVKVNSS